MTPQLIGRINPQKRNRVEYLVDDEAVKAMDGKMVACRGLDVYGPFESHAEIDAWAKQAALTHWTF